MFSCFCFEFVLDQHVLRLFQSIDFLRVRVRALIFPLRLTLLRSLTLLVQSLGADVRLLA